MILLGWVANSYSYTLEEEAKKFYQTKNNKHELLFEYMFGAIQFAKHIPTDYPCEGIITSGYGPRTKPWKEFHEGFDIANKCGTPIFSTAPGVIIYSGVKEGYGECIEINHGYYTTLYGHMRKRLVNAGDEVKKHQLIGELGNTGKTTGPHCHYEIKIRTKTINPETLWNFNKDFMKPKW